uniref:Uncharacterized protein n=1 Tax=Tanacetum cinerariifolium TaxID=118510 RepID=A0A699H7E2_TANCI|nr:hypothetical protein [Tanacetum cinerariifolium]
MQEFWATATVHHHSIRFKMDNKKHIVNLESFREMLHICPRLPSQAFVEPPFEKEILAFFCFLGHSGAIKRLTDVNINKLHQPWRSFVAIINRCLTRKSSSYDSLRLSQAKILWGLYQKRNVDFVYLLWEDFVYQVEHKDTKKSNEMYYPRFTKPKASVRKTKSSSDTIVTPPTADAGPRLSTSAKGKQPATTSKAKSLSALSEVAMTKAQQLKLATKRNIQQIHISQASGSGADEETGSIPGVPNEDEGNDKDDEEEGSDDEQAYDEEEFIHPSLSTHAGEGRRDEESFDPIPKTPKNTDDEGSGEENLGMNVGREEGQDEEDEADTLYRDVNINLGRGMESIFETTSQIDVQTLTSVAPLYVSGPTLTPSIIATITTTLQAPTTLTTVSSARLQDLPNFGSLFGFDHRLKTLEENFFEFTQTNQFAEAVSSIPKIVHRYMDQRMNEAVKVAIQIQSDRLRNEAQAENNEFLKTIVENMQKIIKEQVKEQVKTSYVVAADLSEMELKKILIEKMEGNKSIHRSNEQRNLYKALVEAYESNKIILDTYRDTVTLKRRRDDDADKYKEPSARSDRGSKRRREGKEPESASAPQEKATRGAGKSTQRSKSRQTSASESATAEEPTQTTFEMEEPSHLEFETGADDQPIVEPSQHPEWFS